MLQFEAMAAAWTIALAGRGMGCALHKDGRAPWIQTTCQISRHRGARLFCEHLRIVSTWRAQGVEVNDAKEAVVLILVPAPARCAPSYHPAREV
jgi:hypothetical protein